MSDILAAFARRECHEEVSRQGWIQPCDKPAVAIRRHEEGVYPVCKHHARGDMVPLAEILELI